MLPGALLVSGCGALARTSTLDEPLPPSDQRTAIGAWDLGDGNCIGSIETAGRDHFWVVDCVVKAGYGWCEFGVPLTLQRERTYASARRAWSFTINDDGSLTEVRKGEVVGRYAKSARGICGARNTSAPVQFRPG